MRYVSSAMLIVAAFGCSNETQVTQPLGAIASVARASADGTLRLEP